MEMFYTKESFFEKETDKVINEIAIISILTQLFLSASIIFSYMNHPFLMKSMILSIGYIIIVFVILADGAIEEKILPTHYEKYKNKNLRKMNMVLKYLEQYDNYKGVAKACKWMDSMLQENKNGKEIPIPKRCFFKKMYKLILELESESISKQRVDKKHLAEIEKMIEFSKKEN